MARFSQSDNNYRLENISTPIDDTDATNKAYVDAQSSALTTQTYAPDTAYLRNTLVTNGTEEIYIVLQDVPAAANLSIETFRALTQVRRLDHEVDISGHATRMEIIEAHGTGRHFSSVTQGVGNIQGRPPFSEGSVIRVGAADSTPAYIVNDITISGGLYHVTVNGGFPQDLPVFATTGEIFIDVTSDVIVDVVRGTPQVLTITATEDNGEQVAVFDIDTSILADIDQKVDTPTIPAPNANIPVDAVRVQGYVRAADGTVTSIAGFGRSSANNNEATVIHWTDQNNARHFGSIIDGAQLTGVNISGATPGTHTVTGTVVGAVGDGANYTLSIVGVIFILDPRATYQNGAAATFDILAVEGNPDFIDHTDWPNLPASVVAIGEIQDIPDIAGANQGPLPAFDADAHPEGTIWLDNTVEPALWYVSTGAAWRPIGTDIEAVTNFNQITTPRAGQFVNLLNNVTTTDPNDNTVITSHFNAGLYRRNNDNDAWVHTDQEGALTLDASGNVAINSLVGGLNQTLAQRQTAILNAINALSADNRYTNDEARAANRIVTNQYVTFTSSSTEYTARVGTVVTAIDLSSAPVQIGGTIELINAGDAFNQLLFTLPASTDDDATPNGTHIVLEHQLGLVYAEVTSFTSADARPYNIGNPIATIREFQSYADGGAFSQSMTFTNQERVGVLLDRTEVNMVTQYTDAMARNANRVVPHQIVKFLQHSVPHVGVVGRVAEQQGVEGGFANANILFDITDNTFLTPLNDAVGNALIAATVDGSLLVAENATGYAVFTVTGAVNAREVTATLLYQQTDNTEGTVIDTTGFTSFDRVGLLRDVTPVSVAATHINTEEFVDIGVNTLTAVALSPIAGSTNMLATVTINRDIREYGVVIGDRIRFTEPDGTVVVRILLGITSTSLSWLDTVPSTPVDVNSEVAVEGFLGRTFRNHNTGITYLVPDAHSDDTVHLSIEDLSNWRNWEVGTDNTTLRTAFQAQGDSINFVNENQGIDILFTGLNAQQTSALLNLESNTVLAIQHQPDDGDPLVVDPIFIGFVRIASAFDFGNNSVLMQMYLINNTQGDNDITPADITAVSIATPITRNGQHLLTYEDDDVIPVAVGDLIPTSGTVPTSWDTIGGGGLSQATADARYERLFGRGRQFGFDHNGIEYRGGFGTSASGVFSFTTAMDGTVTRQFITSAPMLGDPVLSYLEQGDYVVLELTDGYLIERVTSDAVAGVSITNQQTSTWDVELVAARSWADDSTFTVDDTTVVTVPAHAIRSLRALDNPRALLVEFKGCDNVISSRTVGTETRTTFTYTRDDDGQQFYAEIQTVAQSSTATYDDQGTTRNLVFDAAGTQTGTNVTVFIYRLGTPATATDVAINALPVVAVKRIYNTTAAGNPTRIDVRGV